MSAGVVLPNGRCEPPLPKLHGGRPSSRKRTDDVVGRSMNWSSMKTVSPLPVTIGVLLVLGELLLVHRRLQLAHICRMTW